MTQETNDNSRRALSELTDQLGIAVYEGCASADLISEAIRRFTALPRKGTPAADLTEEEKLALCIAAGAPTETAVEGGLLTVRTTVPCGVADRGDGGYIVAVGAMPNAEVSGTRWVSAPRPSSGTTKGGAQ